MSVDLSEMIRDEDGYRYVPYDSASNMDIFTLNLNTLSAKLFYYSDPGGEVLLIKAKPSNIKYDRKVNPQFEFEESANEFPLFEISVRIFEEDVGIPIFPHGIFSRSSCEYTNTEGYGADLYVCREVFNRLANNIHSMEGIALPIPNGKIDCSVDYPLLSKVQFSHEITFKN